MLQVTVGNHSRGVPSTGSCEDDVEVAAVIAATWLREPPVQRRAPAPLLRRVEVVAPLQLDAAPIAVTPEPLAAAIAEPVVTDDPVSEAPLVAVVARVEPAPVPARSIDIAPYAMARGTIGTGFAGGAAVGVDVGNTWGALAELDFASARTVALGPGWVSFWRAALSAGPRLKLSRAAWFAEPSLALAAGLIFATGIGFPASFSGTAASVGACANVRAGRELGRGVSAFVSAGGCAWLNPAFTFAPQGFRRVEPLEANLAAGLAWSIR